MENVPPPPAADALHGAAPAPATAHTAAARPAPTAPPAPAAPSTALTPPPVTADPPEDPDALPEFHDLDEYRWVPVLRIPRHDGWSPEKQRRFIEVLADTGLVGAAARAVGMTRESAYRLRRSGHGADFARAWDAARRHAGALLEDVAFERALEGLERNVYDELGQVICTKRVYNDRLLMFLLRHLKPERYGSALVQALASRRQSVQEPAQATTPEPTMAQPTMAPPAPAPALSVDASLRAMEPALPAPIETLMDAETLRAALDIADAADGIMPHFLSGIPLPKTPEEEQAEADAAQIKRGEEMWNRLQDPDAPNSMEDLAALSRYIDPGGWNQPPGNKRYT